jgi:hypothetical protein
VDPEEGMDTSYVLTRSELEVVVIGTVKSSHTMPVRGEDVIVAGLGCPSVAEREVIVILSKELCTNGIADVVGRERGAIAVSDACESCGGVFAVL